MFSIHYITVTWLIKSLEYTVRLHTSGWFIGHLSVGVTGVSQLVTRSNCHSLKSCDELTLHFDGCLNVHNTMQKLGVYTLLAIIHFCFSFTLSLYADQFPLGSTAM